jgi:hypothetical protein
LDTEDKLAAGPVSETRLKSAGSVVVTSKAMPAPIDGDRQIHPRRALPLVPERSDTEADEK